jgi:hypothetical protein
MQPILLRLGARSGETPRALTRVYPRIASGASCFQWQPACKLPKAPILHSSFPAWHRGKADEQGLRKMDESSPFLFISLHKKIHD